MILFIDNYDSFVHNLVRYVAELGERPLVRRNDGITLEEVEELAPSHIVISPGPKGPAEAGISKALIARFGATTPILGVCLGHQAIAEVYGAKVVRAPKPIHGRVSMVRHGGTGLFASLPSPLQAMRYHSLAIDPSSVPDCLQVTATTEDGVIMGVQHREHPVHGLQFHPESVGSEHGHAMLERFLRGEAARPLPPGPDGAPSRPARLLPMA
jgi:anthranilate synthase component 2